jgi:soluble lytic murein transglycosylase-like protein
MLGVILLLLVFASVAEAQIPRAALQYRRDLIGNARVVWGLDAPVAVMAAQVHQESGWRADAKSKFASGLTQFTPATAEWISNKYANELGSNQPLNPAWALRALARYDKYLHDRQATAATDCDRWAFTLAAYNGGEGWINRDRRMAQMNGADPRKWWGHVEHFSPRARWAFTENRNYPKFILLQRQPPYRMWGPGIDCPGVV